MALTSVEENFVRKEKKTKELFSSIMQAESDMWATVKIKKGNEDWAGIQADKQKYRDDIKPLQDELKTLGVERI